MTVINDLKQELKGLAKQVSATKVEYKQLQKDKKPYYAIDQHNRLRTEYRHKHIAYCLVRGKAYEQIEQPKEENRPNMTMVYRYVATVYIKMLEQCSDDYRLVYDILKDEALAKVEHLRKTAQPSVYIHAPAERMQPYAITPKPPTAVQVSQAIKTFNPGVSLLKAFVIVRRDLSKQQQAVQAGHGLAQFLIEHGTKGWVNGTLIYLKADSEQMLLEYEEKLKNRGLPTSRFVEPDIDWQVTSVCTITDLEIPELSELPLMR